MTYKYIQTQGLPFEPKDSVWTVTVNDDKDINLTVNGSQYGRGLLHYVFARYYNGLLPKEYFSPIDDNDHKIAVLNQVREINGKIMLHQIEIDDLQEKLAVLKEQE